MYGGIAANFPGQALQGSTSDGPVVERVAAVRSLSSSRKQGEAGGIGMANHRAGKLDEGTRHREVIRAWEARRLSSRLLLAEQIAFAASHLPDHRVGRHARLREVAGGVAPAFKIVGRGERHPVRVDHRPFA